MISLSVRIERWSTRQETEVGMSANAKMMVAGIFKLSEAAYEQ